MRVLGRGAAIAAYPRKAGNVNVFNMNRILSMHRLYYRDTYNSDRPLPAPAPANPGKK